MSSNTHGNLILLGVTLVVLTGCALLVYKVVSGKKGNKCPDGQEFDSTSASCIQKCATGTTYYPAYTAFNNGCLPCDPTDTTNCATCSADGDCKNGGSCIMVNGPNGKGICNCVSPYTGNTCDSICTPTGNQCQNGGICVSGKCDCVGQWTGQFCEKAQTITCSPETCVLPLCTYTAGKDNNDPTCTCSPHVIPDSSTGSPCGKCEDGYGPPGDCSLKFFNHPINLSTVNCWNSDLYTRYSLDKKCQEDFGQWASWASDRCPNLPDDGCNPGSLLGRQKCTIPQFYADPSFDPSIWDPCVDKGDDNPDNTFGQRPKGYLAAAPQDK